MHGRDDRVVDGKRPKPMPTTDERRLTSAWPFFVDPNVEVLHWPREGPSLTDAVASIVGIAAQRARSSGTLDALRAAVEAALRAGQEPAESSPSPPFTTNAGAAEAPPQSG